MASSDIKGNMVKLQTFMKWSENNILGHKTKECDSIIYVNEMYCKVCARNKHVVLANAEIKEATKVSVERFINGTTNVTNDAVSLVYVSLNS